MSGLRPRARTRPRVIGISFNVEGTGLTRVMRAVLRGLASDFDITYLGIGYAGPVSQNDGLRIHPTNPRGGDVFAASQALEMVRRDPPDAVLILNDIWLFDLYRRVLEPVRNHTAFIGYVPVDGAIVHEEVVLPLLWLDRVVVYTRWAADQLERAFARLKLAGHGGEYPRIGVVGHGVDDAVFKAPPGLVAAGFDPQNRAEIKRRVFPRLDDPQHSFVVLNANRPNIRKRIDTTIEAFALFAADKPRDVQLCLHHAVGQQETAELFELGHELGISHRLIHNPLSPQGGPLGEDDLARLYSACDVGINTAMGEGWGLIAFEHAATGAAQIVPRHSACGALWNDDVAQMIEPSHRAIPHFSRLEMATVNANAAAAAIEALYSDRSQLRHLSRAGYEHARRPELRWDSIACRWRATLSEVIADRVMGQQVHLTRPST